MTGRLHACASVRLVFGERWPWHVRIRFVRVRRIVFKNARAA